MLAHSFRRILPLLMLGSLALSSCTVREERRPDYGYNGDHRRDRHHDRHDRHDHNHDDHDRHD